VSLAETITAFMFDAHFLLRMVVKSRPRKASAAKVCVDYRCYGGTECAVANMAFLTDADRGATTGKGRCNKDDHSYYSKKKILVRDDLAMILSANSTNTAIADESDATKHVTSMTHENLS